MRALIRCRSQVKHKVWGAIGNFDCRLNRWILDCDAAFGCCRTDHGVSSRKSVVAASLSSITIKNPTIEATIEVTDCPPELVFHLTPAPDQSSHHRWTTAGFSCQANRFGSNGTGRLEFRREAGREARCHLHRRKGDFGSERCVVDFSTTKPERTHFSLAPWPRTGRRCSITPQVYITGSGELFEPVSFPLWSRVSHKAVHFRQRIPRV